MKKKPIFATEQEQYFMKFFYLFCIGLSVTSSLFSQVGVNTKSPLGILHIDPKGDTSGTIVSTIQDSDDIIVDALGLTA